MFRRVGMLWLALMLLAGMAAPVAAKPRQDVRFATFNASLNRFNQGDLLAELQAAQGGVVGPQLDAVLQIIDINDPDVLLINEFDYDPDAGAAFADLTGYPYFFIAPSNTGIPSGFDLDNSGGVGGPNDAFGFGFFPGQFGMLVMSRFPIGDVRTFQNFLWADMPDARLPTNPDGTPWYSAEELDVVRLSSKSHWDVPIEIGAKVVHFLVSHPTPPVFDGPEDRNGTRNADEIRFWADYIIPSRSGYIYDDAGGSGGLTPGAFFVVAGDQNSDPLDGDSIPGSAQQLLDHPRVNSKVTPASDGGPEAAILQDLANDDHRSDPAYDTADFNDVSPGNLRADYVLPSKALQITDSAVFWPVQADPASALTSLASDHRLVWVDVRVPGR